MNKSEFIAAMEAQLIRLPKADRDDILNDYESHFVNGIAEGRTEEEVSAQLGDPVELASVYLENLPAGSKGAPYTPPVEEPAAAYEPAAEQSYDHTPYSNFDSQPQPAPAAQPEKKESDPLGIVAVVLLSIFVAMPVLWSIIGILIGAFASSIGFIAAAIALVILGATTAGFGAMAAVGMILIGVSLVALAVLAISLGVLGTKGTIWLVKWYVEMCKKLIGGGK